MVCDFYRWGNPPLRWSEAVVTDPLLTFSGLIGQPHMAALNMSVDNASVITAKLRLAPHPRWARGSYRVGAGLALRIWNSGVTGRLDVSL